MQTIHPSNTPRLRRLILPVALAALAAAPAARAHSVWIESTGENALVLRFGEPGEAFETSPGHLDSLATPAAWTFDAEGKPAAFEVTKNSDHFLFVGAEAAKPAFAETGFPVRKYGDNPATKPFFHMRWLPSGLEAAEAKSALTLDIVPAAEPGVFRVYFRGEPVSGAKIFVHAPDAESELTSDADGFVRFAAKASGLHLITTHHREPMSGFAGGRAYERVSHNAALAWRQP